MSRTKKRRTRQTRYLLCRFLPRNSERNRLQEKKGAQGLEPHRHALGKGHEAPVRRPLAPFFAGRRFRSSSAHLRTKPPTLDGDAELRQSRSPFLYPCDGKKGRRAAAGGITKRREGWEGTDNATRRRHAPQARATSRRQGTPSEGDPETRQTSTQQPPRPRPKRANGGDRSRTKEKGSAPAAKGVARTAGCLSSNTTAN